MTVRDLYSLPGKTQRLLFADPTASPAIEKPIVRTKFLRFRFVFLIREEPNEPDYAGNYIRQNTKTIHIAGFLPVTLICEVYCPREWFIEGPRQK